MGYEETNKITMAIIVHTYLSKYTV